MEYLAALGGNLDANSALFAKAFENLERLGVRLKACSDVMRTAPVGAAAGTEFLNAAALLESNLSPPQVLSAFHTVEDACGRVRDVRWGPRTLDLDLLLAGDVISSEPELLLPHPALWYRDFVLRPAVQIAGSLRHPVLGSTLQELWRRLQERPLRIRIRPSDAGLGQEKLAGLSVERIRRRLVAEVSGAEWLLPEDSGAVFCEAFLLPATEVQPPYSYVAAQPKARRVTLFVRDEADGVEQLRQLCVAIGCNA